MAHERLIAEEPSEENKGWRIYLQAEDGNSAGYPFGENVVALNKRCAVQMIKDRWPERSITPAPRDDPETERFWERF